MTDHEEQAMPTPNENVAIQDLVVQDMMRRKLLGIQRYGTPLQAGNGRDALRDAYEEALDLTCYLRQAIEERDGASRLETLELAGPDDKRSREWIESKYAPLRRP